MKGLKNKMSIKAFCKRGLAAMLACAMVAPGVGPVMQTQAATLDSGEEYITTANGLSVKITATYNGAEGNGTMVGINQTGDTGGVSNAKFEDLVDGDISTGVIFRGSLSNYQDNLADADYVQVEFEEAISFKSVIFDFEPGSGDKYGEKSVLSYTTDGITWNDLNTTIDGTSMSYHANEAIAGVTAVRLTNAYNEGENHKRWVRLREITVDAEGLEPWVTGINVTPPTKKYYATGDELDTAGMIVTATYSDGSTAEITAENYTVSGFDSSTTGAKTVTVKSGYKTATFTVNVVEKNSAADESRDLEVTKITATASSSQGDGVTEGPVQLALDGKESTWWHSEWNPSWLGSVDCAEKLYVDMKFDEATLVDAVRYLPRNANGDITGYCIYGKTSEDAEWTILAEGTWTRNADWKIAEFNPVELIELRLTATATAGDAANKYASAKEIRVRKAVDVTKDLIAYYNFDDVEADATSVENIVDADTYEAALLGGTFTEENAKYGQALKLAGGDANGLSITGIMNTGTNSYSISMWYKQDAANKMILAQQDGARRTLLLVYPDGHYTTNVNNAEVGGTSTRTGTEWQHVTWVYDVDAENNSSSVTFYANGELDATVDSGNESNWNVFTNLLIGRHKNSGGTSFVGLLDEIRVYDRAITAEEAKAIYGVAPAVPVTNVTLDQTELIFNNIGDKATLNATFEPENAPSRNLSWKSSDIAVAKVADGVVTAVGNGKATITATTYDGKVTAQCEVTVGAIIATAGNVGNSNSIGADGKYEKDPCRMLDGNSGSNWLSDPNAKLEDSWVNFELSETAVVDGLKLYYGAANYIHKAYEVLVSTDGQNWTKVCEGTFENTAGEKTIKFKPVEAKHVRLVPTDKYGQELAIWEAEILYSDVATEEWFIGGSLRMDYADDYDKTCLRFMYEFPSEFNGMTVDATTEDNDGGSWKWTYGKTESMGNTKGVADGRWQVKDNGMVESNIVFTNIGRSNYSTSLYTQLAVTYSDASGANTLTVYDTVVAERSVNDVAGAIENAYKDSVDEREVKQYNYALGILGKTASAQ